MSTSPHLAEQAKRLVDDMATAGATFEYRPAISALPATFTYELRAGGDRKRCRLLIASAKGESPLWAAVVAEVGDRCRRAA